MQPRTAFRFTSGQRGDTYLARGSYERERFGETLGQDPTTATSRLRKLLTEIEDGSYLRPSEARHRLLSNGKVPRLTLRQLVEEFLLEKRKTRGNKQLATIVPVYAPCSTSRSCQATASDGRLR